MMLNNILRPSCALLLLVMIQTLSLAGTGSPAGGPPIPGPGQTVHWTIAMSPIDFSSSATIPAGGTLIVDPGVVVNVGYGATLTVSGTLSSVGGAGQEVRFNVTSVYPPAIDVYEGSLSATFTSFLGQVRVENAATVELSDCSFSGYGLLWAQEIQAVAPFIRLVRCTFQDSLLSLSDAVSILEDNQFLDSGASVLRGYVKLLGTNIVRGGTFAITREDAIQPYFVDHIDGRNVTTGAPLILEGSEFVLGENVVLQNNLYPLTLHGGLLPGSNVPVTGNTINAIDAGELTGPGRLANFGIPYRLNGPANGGGGAAVTIDPGVVIEAMHPQAGRIFNSGGRLISEGLPWAPIEFRSGVPGQGWQGLQFALAGDSAPRLEYVNVKNATFGVISRNTQIYADSCLFQSNQVGLNANSYGAARVRKSRFLDNVTGANMTDTSPLDLSSVFSPNLFDGNTASIDAFEYNSRADARYAYWGDPSGPQHPNNPGGQGDPVIGPGASQVNVLPFSSAPPDAGDLPPIVRLIEPGPRWSLSPDFLAEVGSRFLIQWDLIGPDVVKQRIEFSPDGNWDSRFGLVVDNLPPSQRSYEWVVPDPGFAITFSPQFLRVVATDPAGQEGFDMMPLSVPSTSITGNLTIDTNLAGQVFHGGDPMPDMDVTSSLSGPGGTFTPMIVFEDDGAVITGLFISGSGMFFWDFPHISTDRARLALQVRINSNDVRWFFADEYFSVRHDPRFGFQPPAIQLQSPAPGANPAGGSLVPIRWTAQAPEGLRSFDVRASTDGGRTWHLVASDLPATATGYDWLLPASAGISDLRMRVTAQDRRFQKSSDQVQISVAPGGPTCQTDLGFGGPGIATLTVCGSPLATSGTAQLELSGAPGGALAWFVAGMTNNPQPLKGGMLVPTPPQVLAPFVLDQTGSLIVSGIQGGNGPLDVFIQFVIQDAAQPLGYAFSNAVQVSFLP